MAKANARGVLYPGRLPTFHRVPAADDIHTLVRWFWIPQWSLPLGRTSRQRLLPFPASNLVVQPEGITLAGPATGASHRDLRGSGWAVGALLRPAALASLAEDPRLLRDREITLDLPTLHRAVVGAMSDGGAHARERAVARFSGWVRHHLEADGDGLIANAMEDLVATDPDIVNVEQLARRLGVSARTLQRRTARYVGMPPLAIIRRYRLQEAAQRLREDPTLTVAEVAADLGYADHAHLAADFRQVLGLAPSAYRHGAAHRGADSRS